MISYEACLLLRVVPKIETAKILKRAAQSIFDKGGIIRKLENMGTRDMPYKTSVHGQVYKTASYFLLEFNLPIAKLVDLEEEYSRDIDIIRRRIYKKLPADDFECTLHEELKPPPYRKSVQELLKSAKKVGKKKGQFSYNSGLDYSPFQR